MKDKKSKPRTFFGYFGASALGLLVFVGFYRIILAILFLLLNRYLRFTSNFIGYSTYLADLIGIVLGIYSYKKKNIFYNIWKLNKRKFIFTLFLGALITLGTTIPGYETLSQMGVLWFRIIASLVATILISYPFGALLEHIYFSFKKLKHKAAWFLLLILINPVFFLTSSILRFVPTYYGQDECGVVISDLTAESVLKDYNVTNKKISSIGDIQINDVADVSKALKAINSTSSVRVVVGGEEIHVKPIYDSETRDYGLGIYLQERLCR